MDAAATINAIAQIDKKAMCTRVCLYHGVVGTTSATAASSLSLMEPLSMDRAGGGGGRGVSSSR